MFTALGYGVDRANSSDILRLIVVDPVEDQQRLVCTCMADTDESMVLRERKVSVIGHALIVLADMIDYFLRIFHFVQPLFDPGHILSFADPENSRAAEFRFI